MSLEFIVPPPGEGVKDRKSMGFHQVLESHLSSSSTNPNGTKCDVPITLSTVVV